MKKHIGEIGLFIVAIIWGSGFVATRLCLDGGFTPLQILTMRFLLASLILGTIFFKQIKNNINKETVKIGTLLGLFLFLAFATQTIGLQYTTPSKNAFITAANIVVVPFIGFILYKRKLDKIGVSSSIIALVGIGILSLEANFSVNVGDFLTFLCAIAFAFHIFFTGEFSSKHNLIVLTITQFLVVFILSLITQLFMGQGKVNADISAYLGIVYLGVFGTTIGFLAQTACQKKVDGTKTALILSTEALFGTLFSILLLGEVITIKLIIGSVLILGAVITAETKLSFLKKNKEKISSTETM